MNDKRRHERYGVRLLVRYTKAEEFVSDYIENLSAGGLFIAGAHELPLFTETDVAIELPGQGSWTVRARVVFLIDEAAANAAGRRPGAGMQLITKPPGYDDALLGYLLRLGRRRDHQVMVAEGLIGAHLFADAGYCVTPLESEDEVAIALADEDAKIVAVIVSPSLFERYRDRLGTKAREVLFAASSIEEVQDILARVDSLL